MKHKWKIEPRGRKTRYYTCVRCGERVVSMSRKFADTLGGQCKQN